MIGELVGAALALLGAQEPRARIAYSHGDAIYSIASDGSDRRRLVAGDGPVFSPAGDALAFTRSPSEDRSSVWIAAPDGSQPRELVPSGKDGVYATAPAWSPDGTQLAYARTVITERSLVSSIEVMRRDGTGRREVLRLEARRGLETVASPVWTPDGGRLLYTRVSAGREIYRFDIRSIAAAGGGDALVLRDALGGAFSPDGTRLAFSDANPANGRDCGSDECFPSTELAISAADGSGRRVLLRARGEDGAPSWSPDGARIAFSSGRNAPASDDGGGGAEVYTIAPDGSCLTWLTNGDTGSGSPAWAPGGGASAAPACGDLGRRPLLELHPGARARGSLWAGRRLGTALLSSVSGRGRNTTYVYDDCTEFDPKACPAPFTVTQSDLCSDQTIRHILPDLKDPRRVRGAAILAAAPGDDRPRMLTGRSLLFFGPDSSMAPARQRALHARIVAALRPYGHARTARLPRPRVPAKLVRYVPGARSC